MAIKVGITGSVGVTIPRFTISVEQNNDKLVTLNIIFIVVNVHIEEYDIT